MREVTVVGAGFAGLSVAYELVHAGFKVTVHEKQERAGGLIHTERTAHGLAESAANALLANYEIENLFTELGVPFAPRRRTRHKRYIFWDKPRRWPLGWRTTSHLLRSALSLSLGREELLPRAGESIASWARRFAGSEFEEKLLSPALQGVYAGDPEQMSAVLVLRNLMGDRPRRGKLKGSVSPVGGMGALIKALSENIQESGGRIVYGSEFQVPEFITSPLVIATSAWAASEILKTARPKVAKSLGECESLALVSATLFFEPEARDLQGFGCLFPRAQGFSALGVLFNNCVFEGRSDLRSETWIIGGARFPDAVALSDGRILELIEQDRRRLSGQTAAPLSYRITHWPRAVPHYTLDWEKTLLAMHVEPPLFLHGNYMGELGLARIYTRSRKLAEKIKELYG